LTFGWLIQQDYPMTPFVNLSRLPGGRCGLPPATISRLADDGEAARRRIFAPVVAKESQVGLARPNI